MAQKSAAQHGAAQWSEHNQTETYRRVRNITAWQRGAAQQNDAAAPQEF